MIQIEVNGIPCFEFVDEVENRVKLGRHIEVYGRMGKEKDVPRGLVPIGSGFRSAQNKTLVVGAGFEPATSAM